MQAASRAPGSPQCPPHAAPVRACMARDLFTARRKTLLLGSRTLHSGAGYAHSRIAGLVDDGCCACTCRPARLPSSSFAIAVSTLARRAMGRDPAPAPPPLRPKGGSTSRARRVVAPRTAPADNASRDRAKDAVSVSYRTLLTANPRLSNLNQRRYAPHVELGGFAWQTETAERRALPEHGAIDEPSPSPQDSLVAQKRWRLRMVRCLQPWVALCIRMTIAQRPGCWAPSVTP